MPPRCDGGLRGARLAWWWGVGFDCKALPEDGGRGWAQRGTMVDLWSMRPASTARCSCAPWVPQRAGPLSPPPPPSQEEGVNLRHRRGDEGGGGTCRAPRSGTRAAMVTRKHGMRCSVRADGGCAASGTTRSPRRGRSDAAAAAQPRAAPRLPESTTDAAAAEPRAGV